jgi:hypothetical protein
MGETSYAGTSYPGSTVYNFVTRLQIITTWKTTVLDLHHSVNLVSYISSEILHHVFSLKNSHSLNSSLSA